MPRTNVSLSMMVEVKEAMMSASERVRKLSQGGCLEDVAIVQELYDVLKTATERVAILLNATAPANRLPPELLTRIFDLAGSGGHPNQIVPLTHVCRYWRTILLSYPRIWSTVYMKPGDPNVISEWLERSQEAPLTVVAEFTDSYEHPPCLYQDSATTTLASNDCNEVCSRHEAILSLRELLPHCSRIRDLSILLHFSNPYSDGDDYEGEPTLLYHQFFRETLPNLQRLDFRAAHIEQDRNVIPIPGFLLANLPSLKELGYLGVIGGLTRTAKNLTSCEIGSWGGSVGPAIIHPDELQAFFDNNRNIESLTINEFEFVSGNHRAPTAVPTINLKFLEISCLFISYLGGILSFIHAPQFKNLDTVQLSLFPSGIIVEATDGSGHTFKFWRLGRDPQNLHPLQHFGAVITTLRLDRGITLEQLGDKPASHRLFRPFNTVQVLEFDGTIADCIRNSLSVPGIFPGLKVIRVAVSRHDCKRTLRLLAVASKRRMVEGNPLTTIEPLSAEGEDELDQSLRVEWEESYKAEGIHNFLSG